MPAAHTLNFLLFFFEKQQQQRKKKKKQLCFSFSSISVDAWQVARLVAPKNTACSVGTVAQKWDRCDFLLFVLQRLYG